VTKGKDKYNRIASSLRERASKEGSLPSFLDAYQILLALQMETKSRIRVGRPHLGQEVATDRLKQGAILLKFEELPLDWILVADQCRAVGRFIADQITHVAGDASAMTALASESQALKQAVADWYEGRSLSLAAGERRIDEELLRSAMQATMYPFLVARAETLEPLLQHDLWRRRQCPICGGRPDFAFLDKERGGRWLLCSRCDTEWLFQRLECPYCGTRNHKALAYYTDKTGLYRLYTCQQCHTYIKCVDLRKSAAEVLLPLERVLTTDLYRQGVEAGFGPG
jgi:FdhE protein